MAEVFGFTPDQVGELALSDFYALVHYLEQRTKG